MNNNQKLISNNSNILISLFLSLFIIVGIGLATYSFVKLANYNFAEQVEATVVSTEYNDDRTGEIVFGFERNGEYMQTKLHLTNVKTYPYHVGEKVSIHLNDLNEIQLFGTAEIIVLVGGFLFMLTGTGFLYFIVLRKKSMFDIAYEYENAMIPPENISDPTLKNEAIADELTKLPINSIKRKMGEIKVWNTRLNDRFKSFTVWEHLFFLCLFILPMIALSVYPLFLGQKVTFSMVCLNIIFGFFIGLIIGVVLKIFYFAWWKILAKLGKFTEKRHATVIHGAFESESSFQIGSLSRTHTINKKFRIVALIDGKRSIGYVKGNVPPSKGTILKVLIRPNHPRKWIIDKE